MLKHSSNATGVGSEASAAERIEVWSRNSPSIAFTLRVNTISSGMKRRGRSGDLATMPGVVGAKARCGMGLRGGVSFGVKDAAGVSFGGGDVVFFVISTASFDMQSFFSFFFVFLLFLLFLIVGTNMYFNVRRFF
jgi:hypothetical protein